MSPSRRHRFPSLHHHSEDEPSSHEIVEERAPHPIWLPRIAEPVTLALGPEKLPARVLERTADLLEVEPGATPVTGRAEVVRIDGRGRPGIQITQIAPYDQWRLIRFTIDCQGKETFRHPELDARATTGRPDPQEPDHR